MEGVHLVGNSSLCFITKFSSLRSLNISQDMQQPVPGYNALSAAPPATLRPPPPCRAVANTTHGPSLVTVEADVEDSLRWTDACFVAAHSYDQLSTQQIL